jgi:hypothetical protein
VSIVTSLYAAENGYLFIDEMDNGIHYSVLGELWNTIVTNDFIIGKTKIINKFNAKYNPLFK